MKIKSFTLIEVIIAAVLLTIGVAGGIAGYKVADRQIERSNIKNMLINENEVVAEKIASWDVDEHAGDLESGNHDVTDISNTKLAEFSPKVTYTVTDCTTPAPYKEIVVNAEVTYGGKTIKVQTEAIKVNVEEPIIIPPPPPPPPPPDDDDDDDDDDCWPSGCFNCSGWFDCSEGDPLTCPGEPKECNACAGCDCTIGDTYRCK